MGSSRALRRRPEPSRFRCVYVYASITIYLHTKSLPEHVQDRRAASGRTGIAGASLAEASRDRWDRLQSSRDALVPRRAHPGIAILAGREFVRSDAGSNPLFALGMVDAESVRKGEMPRGHRIVHRDRDDHAGPLRAEAGVSTVGDA